MTVVDLTEHGPARSLPLPDAVGRALAASRTVEAVPDLYLPGYWRLKAGRTVGVFSVTIPREPRVTIRIAPKVTIARLLFLLGYSRNPKGWRADDVTVSAEDDLLPAVARLFERQAEAALQQGMIQGYRTAEETSVVVRGRMRNADQIRRHHGRFFPVEIAHDDYTVDIPENQLLATACERLARLPHGVPHETHARLLRLRTRLADVTPLTRGHALPRWYPTRLNARYHAALRLAELVLRGSSVEHLAGDVVVSGFLFDMARVFEDFLSAALRAALAPSGGRCVLQAAHHLDEDGAIRIVPDIVYVSDDGHPIAVADAKYKAEKPEGYPDADLYQMLAYCTALGLSEGHLIYAKGNGPHAAHRVRRAGITIHQHALDLNQPPSAVLADVQALALGHLTSAGNSTCPAGTN
jgi:5-methylcytosine-specific restriction enzyme subunit McrC